MKRIYSKVLSSVLLIVLLVGSNGCMTYDVIQHTKGEPAPYFSLGNWDEQKNIDGKPHPAYWALLPLSIPADIVTSPIQGILFLVFVSNLQQGWHCDNAYSRLAMVKPH